MSTTLDRAVAMSYAASDGVGILFEVQQGMVSRGADIQWLSQVAAPFPHGHVHHVHVHVHHVHVHVHVHVPCPCPMSML
jgi:hypothetical protein